MRVLPLMFPRKHPIWLQAVTPSTELTQVPAEHVEKSHGAPPCVTAYGVHTPSRHVVLALQSVSAVQPPVPPSVPVAVHWQDTWLQVCPFSWHEESQSLAQPVPASGVWHVCVESLHVAEPGQSVSSMQP